MTTQETVNECLELWENFSKTCHWSVDAEFVVELYKCHCLNQLNGTLLMIEKNLRGIK